MKGWYKMKEYRVDTFDKDKNHDKKYFDDVVEAITYAVTHTNKEEENTAYLMRRQLGDYYEIITAF